MRILILSELHRCKSGIPPTQIQTCTGANQGFRAFFFTTKLIV